MATWMFDSNSDWKKMEYGRRNKTAFRIQVEKVYQAIKTESEINDLETAHLTKRAKHSHNESSDDSGSSSEDVLENSNTSHMNSSLTSLYRKGTSDTYSTVGDLPDASKVSTGGWFIDRDKGSAKTNILIDLSEDQPIDAVSKEVSMLEPSKKSGKRKKTDENAKTLSTSKKGTALAKSRSTKLQYPTLKFEDVGGNEATLTEVCKLLIHMRHPEIYQQLGMVPPRGFLLHGPPGCGKTLLAQAVAGELDLPLLKVSAPELVSGVSGESEQKLRELFDLAVSSAPCILFIDEIDAITPKREIASKDMERRIVAQILTCMDDLNSRAFGTQLLVIGATNRPDSLDPALRRAGRFDREICLGIPDEQSRLRILKTLCRKLKMPEDFDYGKLARLTPGYVGADLMALCREAAMNAVNRVLLVGKVPAKSKTSILSSDLPLGTEAVTNDSSENTGTASSPRNTSSEIVDVNQLSQYNLGHEHLPGDLWHLLQLLKNTNTLPEHELTSLSLIMSDFETSLSNVQPSAKREGFATVPDVTWDDVGALHEIREELTMAILAPVRSPEQFRALGLSAPSGVLLAGPPGCGKTLLAKAVANESGLNFISVKGPELLNMYVGESERAVRQVFQRGHNSAPCVIFFDEIDALCPRRSGHESGASIRVVNQLLTEMDGLETRRQVFIMAATNRPDIIDPAILRPGRLDKTLYVGMPPPADRLAILLTITKNGTKPQLEQDVSLEEIAYDERCDCFTGADLTALVREASVNALKPYLKSSCFQPSSSGNTFSPGPVADIRVSKKNVEEAFGKIRPSVSKKDQMMYEQLKVSLRG
ncbi:nuclear valosin-containing protein-like isoform X3 [Hippocampus comes]|uniref:nuclear valosin-containing protein-like isoform X3 n=1 Tax=Hippocampus comes TaxID=109280 RepID=UPI00094E839E|nr:PREDICTED: nuclear valosin-containing protein-like isoform X3 [Hippocampus comes]XP_019727651.1 PREDICTED: nuclear valosin-containing protein-like isoform X3 [Hippocampus comes]XP_019727652.1 PREDICTED: nuclear valosin-containing protein-like isoform X3 [Hippocampus comes]